MPLLSLQAAKRRVCALKGLALGFNLGCLCFDAPWWEPTKHWVSCSGSSGVWELNQLSRLQAPAPIAVLSQQDFAEHVHLTPIWFGRGAVPFAFGFKRSWGSNPQTNPIGMCCGWANGIHELAAFAASHLKGSMGPRSPGLHFSLDVFPAYFAMDGLVTIFLQPLGIGRVTMETWPRPTWLYDAFF